MSLFNQNRYGTAVLLGIVRALSSQEFASEESENQGQACRNLDSLSMSDVRFEGEFVPLATGTVFAL